MIFLGHPYFESQNLYIVKDQDEILQTPPNSIVFIENIDLNIELINFCIKNNITFSLKITSIKEALFANQFGAIYLICSIDLAKSIQSLAESYLFDTKVLVQIDDDKYIEELAKFGVDGVIFDNAIKKIL